MTKSNIKLPVELLIRVYGGLLLSILLFGSLCAILLVLGGPILLCIGLIPLVIVLATKNKEIGIKIKPREHPRLMALIKKTADDLGIKPPHDILLTPDAGIRVTGFFRKKLIIGIASLRALSEGEFQSIIAHELGHFYGYDTIIGGFFWRMDAAMEKSSKFGKAWWKYVPILQLALVGVVIMLFYKVYKFFFKVTNHFYSRQTEFRADYVASRIAGSTNFHNGLLNYAAYSNYFENVGFGAMETMLEKEKAFKNIYEQVHGWYNRENVKGIKKRLLENNRWRLFSTHPTIKNRLDKIKPVDKPLHKKPATSLFSRSEKLEKDMTNELTMAIHHSAILHKFHQEAVRREGRCQHCGEQFEKLKELFLHEQECAKTQGVNMPEFMK
jgi:Zn-dependent protease with chaperone function